MLMLLAAVLVLSSLPALAGERAVTEQPPELTAWVARHAAPLRTLESGGDSADLRTLAVFEALTRHGAQHGYPAVSMARLIEIAPLARLGLERMKQAGVAVGFGTDLIGPLHVHQCLEFALRREVFSPFEVLRSATSVNAGILRQGHRLGRIAPGCAADVIVVEGNPLQDLSCFTQDGRNLPVIVKGGEIVKMTL